jgi:hypothetical protein
VPEVSLQALAHSFMHMDTPGALSYTVGHVNECHPERSEGEGPEAPFNLSSALLGTSMVQSCLRPILCT